MITETVTVEAGGAVYPLWTDIDVQYGAEQAVRTASMTCADPAALAGGGGAGTWALMPDVEVVIRAGGEAVLTGYVRDVAPDHGPDHHAVRVTMVSKTVDAVEASIDHATGWADSMPLDGLVREFDPAGLEVVALDPLEDEEPYQIAPGDSVFGAVEPLARARGTLIYDDGEGRVVMATGPDGRHAGGLALDVNIIAASATLTGRYGHDPVIVRGQGARGRGAAALRLEARAKGTAPRVRPRVVHLEVDATSARLAKRAEWEVRRAAGRARTAQVTVPGWRDAAGTLWTANRLVGLADPLLYLDQDMVISAVRLSQSDRGTVADLSLVDPRALGGEDPKGESDGAWGLAVPKATVDVK